MRQTIYIDVLLSVNFLIDYFLLLLAGRLSGGLTSRIRCCLAALAGAASSLTILLPSMSAWVSAMLLLATAAIMCLIAFEFKSFRIFLRKLAWLYALSTCYAGAVMAAWLLLEPTGLVLNNGMIYIDISPELIILCSVLCYGTISLLSRFSAIKNKGRSRCCVRIEHRGRLVLLDGLIDTGNLLTEPISGLPVIIVSESAVRTVTPKGLADFSSGAGIETGEKLRLVPFSGLGGRGVAAAFLPESIIISHAGKSYEAKAYILPLPKTQGCAAYGAIVNPDAIG